MFLGTASLMAAMNTPASAEPSGLQHACMCGQPLHFRVLLIQTLGMLLLQKVWCTNQAWLDAGTSVVEKYTIHILLYCVKI